MKIAFITGINGQDGSYLAEFLLEKNYQVHGLVSPESIVNTENIDHLSKSTNLHIHCGDLIDSATIVRLIKEISPDEIYNLAAISNIGISFRLPEYTANVNALGTLRLLEAIRINNLEVKTRFYQASTAALFGSTKETPQNETTKLKPETPYAIAKAYAYWITINYRETYGIYACNGIMFNHESPRRGKSFVTRKITRGLANIAYGIENCLYLGNLDAMRDWGHVKDYIRMQWLMLQQSQADDFIVATGKQISIRDFVILAAKQLGIKLEFANEGVDEIATVVAVDNDLAPAINCGDIIIRVDSKFFRPVGEQILQGDTSKAKKILNWEPEFNLETMCREMIFADINKAKQYILLTKNGFALKTLALEY